MVQMVQFVRYASAKVDQRAAAHLAPLVSRALNRKQISMP